MKRDYIGANKRGKQKMSNYINRNYAGSILERASYKKNKVKPYKLYGSLIENRIEKKADKSIWQRIKKSMFK